MKVFAFILAILVLFLSVKPAASALHSEEATEQTCCEDECGAGENEQEPVEEGDDCCGDLCNPFQACCAQLVYSATGSVSIAPVIALPGKMEFALQDFRLLPQYSADFWQPPRLV
jgi:hypothetical protein